MIYRHGDILIIPTEKRKGKKVNKGKSYVLAYGEVTGHKHLLTADRQDTSFGVVEDENGNIVLTLGKSGVLTHEEHKKLEIQEGSYLVVHEREKDWFSMATRKVID